MSNQKTKYRNRNIANKRKIKKAIIKIIFFIIFLWILNLTIEAAASSRTITFTNDAVASQDDEFDPCGLKEVICEGEEVKAPQNANLTPKTDIETIIRQTFPENPEIAVKMAMCESGLVADKMGDGNLAFWHEGELLGRSFGIFQVRTGGMEKNGKIWNRAKANGMTVEEFEKWMQDPVENIKYARDIYVRSGQSWGAWLNCARKTGAIK